MIICDVFCKSLLYHRLFFFSVLFSCRPPRWGISQIMRYIYIYSIFSWVTLIIHLRYIVNTVIICQSIKRFFQFFVLNRTEEILLRRLRKNRLTRLDVIWLSWTIVLLSFHRFGLSSFYFYGDRYTLSRPHNAAINAYRLRALRVCDEGVSVPSLRKLMAV